MTRETGIQAYRIIKENGLLSRRRFEVYDAVVKIGPATTNEVFVFLRGMGDGAKNPTSNSASRFSELRDQGVIQEVGIRKCSVTGMDVIVWDVVDRLPVRIRKEKVLTKDQKIARLEKEVMDLRAELIGYRSRSTPEKMVGEEVVFP